MILNNKSMAMKKLAVLAGLLLPVMTFAQLNGSVLVSGTVVDDRGEPLVAATVSAKGSKTGTASDSLGHFTLVVNQKFPFWLVVTSVGFSPQEIEVRNPGEKLSVQLVTQTFIANEVVVTASRREEKLLQSPVTIEKLDIRSLKESPAPSFYDALGNIKGVQLTTSSLTFKVPNTRGFNVPNNFRFMQVVDGVDVQAATLGVPLGNAIGPTELDIQSVEITPGASSALYGMNAINGMSNLLTKNPFQYQGLSVYQKLGVNHVDRIDKPASPLTETAIRYAKAFSNKFAFKVNASYLKGTDWVANNRGDFNPQPVSNPSFPELTGSNNPGYDGINSYGNESNITITDKNGKVYNVRRTGYLEKDLTDYSVQNIKLDAALHYKLTANTEASYSYRYGIMDGVFQRGNRIRLQGANVQNHKIEIANPDFLLRAYISIENTGKTYAMKPLADNLELSFKTNSKWKSDYNGALNNALINGADLATAHRQARAAADNGRFVPGTAAFDEQVKKIKGINDWDIYPTSSNPLDTTGGAAFSTGSRFYQAEGTWNLHRYINRVNVLVGVDYRVYDLVPDGNNFVDFSKPLKDRNTPGGKDIYYGKFGGFAEASKVFLRKTLKLTTSLRFDKNDQFAIKFNPRFSAVYTLNKMHNFRASWQNGFRFPSLFEAFSFVNNGGVRRVGGLPVVEQGLGYFTNSVLSNSITAYTNRVNALKNQALSQADAQQQASSLLQTANPKSIQPEQINSFEIGYKTSLLENKLFIDAEAYFNAYRYFIGQMEIAVPNRGTVSNFNDTAVQNSLYNNNAATRYRVQVNSQSQVKNYGFAGGVSYNFYKTYSISANANYNKLSQADAKDPLIPGFNTPNWASNLSFGNRAVTTHIGFNLVWHWQNSFYWQNLFGNGTVDAYNTVDAQVSFRAPKIKSAIKIGGTNILNHRYLQYIGGPAIGAFYYVTWTVEDLLK
jgi:outer membrane receptor protein involved in Fe transport